MKHDRRTQAAIDAGHPEWAELPATSWAAQECGSTIYFSAKVCPKGHIAPRHRSNGGCDTCHKDWQADPKRREKERAYRQSPAGQKWARGYKENPETREKDRARQKTPENRAYMRAYLRPYLAHRRALQLKATPPWLTPADHAAMRAIYDECARLTLETGVLHHVDHIVPLQSKCPITKKRNACGLHIPANLQVIPAFDNRSKNCWFDGGW